MSFPVILVVDDEEGILRALRRLFNQASIPVETAGNAEQAMQALRLHRPELILADINMPGMDGLALLAEIKKRELTQGSLPIDVVMMTGYSTKERILQALKAGAAGYLEKPFNNEEILITIQRLLATREMRRANQQARLFMEIAQSISNEMREPLAAIQAYSEAVRSTLVDAHDSMTDDKRMILESFEQVAQGVEGLRGIIESFTHYYVLSDENLDTGLYSFDEAVTAAVKTVIEEIHHHRKDLTFELVPQSGESERGEVRLDLGLFGRNVIRELMVNAARNTPAGGTVRVESKIENGILYLRVDDTGRGVMPDALSRLGEPLTKCHQQSRRSPSTLGEFGFCKSGLGLGLAIARRVVTLHGGKMYFALREEGGLLVGVEIPLKP